MRQKIKKQSYTIPFETELIKNGKIVVSAVDIPSKNGKKHKGVVGIDVYASANLSDLEQTHWQVLIPIKKVKKLRKALKKISKF